MPRALVHRFSPCCPQVAGRFSTAFPAIALRLVVSTEETRLSMMAAPLSPSPVEPHARLFRTQERRQRRGAARAAALDRSRTSRARRPDAGARILGPRRRPHRRGRLLPQGPSPDLPRDRRAVGQEHALRRDHARGMVPVAESGRHGRRHRLRRRARQHDAERRQHRRLCRHRAREVGAAAADRHRHRDCRRGLPARRPLEPGTARIGRAAGVPDRRGRRARAQGLRADAPGGQGRVPDPASPLREPRHDHRSDDRLHRSRREDHRPAAV